MSQFRCKEHFQCSGYMYVRTCSITQESYLVLDDLNCHVWFVYGQYLNANQMNLLESKVKVTYLSSARNMAVWQAKDCPNFPWAHGFCTDAQSCLGFACGWAKAPISTDRRGLTLIAFLRCQRGREWLNKHVTCYVIDYGDQLSMVYWYHFPHNIVNIELKYVQSVGSRNNEQVGKYRIVPHGEYFPYCEPRLLVHVKIGQRRKVYYCEFLYHYRVLLRVPFVRHFWSIYFVCQIECVFAFIFHRGFFSDVLFPKRSIPCAALLKNG